MGLYRTIFLLLVIFATSSFASNPYPILITAGCTPSTCGENTKCTIIDGRPFCSCLNLHTGDPYEHCSRVECTKDEDCPSTQSCVINNCVDPRTPDPCKPSPCGHNAHCDVINEVASCKCQPGYIAVPMTGCRHECEKDSDCADDQSCSDINFRCENLCPRCGEGANCKAINHTATCVCPQGWQGNPLIRCYQNCPTHSDCPTDKKVCLYSKCSNPCEDSCGVNANCELSEITPVCSCPKNMIGNPFINCKPLTPEDPCKPNSCGEHAVCSPGRDSAGESYPLCTCPAGYIGNPLIICKKN